MEIDDGNFDRFVVGFQNLFFMVFNNYNIVVDYDGIFKKVVMYSVFQIMVCIDRVAQILFFKAFRFGEDEDWGIVIFQFEGRSR